MKNIRIRKGKKTGYNFQFIEKIEIGGLPATSSHLHILTLKQIQSIFNQTREILRKEGMEN